MTSFSKNTTMITGVPSNPLKAGDNHAVFLYPLNKPKTHGYSHIQVSPGDHSSEPIVIDDDKDENEEDDDDDNDYDDHNELLQGMAENQRSPCRRIPQDGRFGLRKSSWGFGKDLQNHRHQPVQISGNSSVSSPTGRGQPPQRHNGQSTERYVDAVPTLRAGAGTHPGRKPPSKDTTARGTTPSHDPAQNRTLTPDGVMWETSAEGRTFPKRYIPSTEPYEEAVLSIPRERMVTTVRVNGLDDTTIAESTRSHTNLSDAQQISEANIPGVGRSETSDTSQRTILGSLLFDYPLDESIITDASIPASTQPPDLHDNATEPVTSWNTGKNLGSLHRKKRQKAKPTAFHRSQLSRCHSVDAAEEPSDDHITSDSGLETEYRSSKRQRKTLESNQKRPPERKPGIKSLGSNSATASIHLTEPLPLSFDPPRSQVYRLPDTRIICSQLSGKTLFQLQFTWNGCHHKEDDWNEGGSQGTQRVSGHQEQRSRKGTQRPTSIDDESEVYDIDCILTRWKKRSYLVRWADRSCTWEPKSHLSEDLLNDFEREFDGFRKGVEIIATRVVKRPKSKAERVLYHLKWQGRPEKEKCWVEEDTLSPSLLEEYRKTKEAGTSRLG